MNKLNLNDKDLNVLMDFLAETSNDPLKFVENLFRWDKLGTSKFKSPLKWQRKILEDIKTALDSKEKIIRVATASGHGIGKSALVAWLILWGISTKPYTKGVITANTETQLKTKTWAELSKWYRLSVVAPLLKLTADSVHTIDPTCEKSWRIDMVPWSKHNSEAFAGLHNQGGRVLLIFDEASSIPDTIWEVAEGAMTDDETEIIWIVFGNPTRSSGRFKECFGRFRHRWKTYQISSNDVEITNKKQISRWIEDYGVDSDFVRIRVLGEFPLLSQNQLIGYDTINISRNRNISIDDVVDEPKIIGVDVARFGNDLSVIVLRQGRLIIDIERYYKIDTMKLSGIIAEKIAKFSPDIIFIDQTGVGGGVVDRLHQLGFKDVVGVDFGSSATNKKMYLNKRVEMWHKMSKWIKDKGKLIDDKDLINDLISPTYSYSGDSSQMILEKKDAMKKRGLASPDSADALALTFAHDIDINLQNKNIEKRNNILNDLTDINL